jgi:ribosomal protein L24
MVKGAYVHVVSGFHKDFYGKVISLDEDTAHAVIEVPHLKRPLTVSQHNLEVITQEAYKEGLSQSKDAKKDDGETSLDGNSHQKSKYGVVVVQTSACHLKENSLLTLIVNTDSLEFDKSKKPLGYSNKNVIFVPYPNTEFGLNQEKLSLLLHMDFISMKNAFCLLSVLYSSENNCL